MPEAVTVNKPAEDVAQPDTGTSLSAAFHSYFNMQLTKLENHLKTEI